MACKLWIKIKDDLTGMLCWGTPNINIFSLFSLVSQIPQKRIILYDSVLCLESMGLWGVRRLREKSRSQHLLCNFIYSPGFLLDSLPSMWDSSIQIPCFTRSRKWISSFLPGWDRKSLLYGMVETAYGWVLRIINY